MEQPDQPQLVGVLGRTVDQIDEDEGEVIVRWLRVHANVGMLDLYRNDVLRLGLAVPFPPKSEGNLACNLARTVPRAVVGATSTQKIVVRTASGRTATVLEKRQRGYFFVELDGNANKEGEAHECKSLRRPQDFAPGQDHLLDSVQQAPIMPKRYARVFVGTPFAAEAVKFFGPPPDGADVEAYLQERFIILNSQEKLINYVNSCDDRENDPKKKWVFGTREKELGDFNELAREFKEACPTYVDEETGALKYAEPGFVDAFVDCIRRRNPELKCKTHIQKLCKKRRLLRNCNLTDAEKEALYHADYEVVVRAVAAAAAAPDEEAAAPDASLGEEASPPPADHTEAPAPAPAPRGPKRKSASGGTSSRPTKKPRIGYDELIKTGAGVGGLLIAFALGFNGTSGA